MHNKAHYRCRVTKTSLLFLWIGVMSVAYALRGLVSARLFCDEMAGAVCVCVCFALKVQLKCVGFPAL